MERESPGIVPEVVVPAGPQQVGQELSEIISQAEDQEMAIRARAESDWWRLNYLRNLRYDSDVKTHWLMPINAWIQRHPFLAAILTSTRSIRF